MTFSSGSLSGPNMGIDLAVIQPRNVYRVPVHFFRKAYPIKFLEEDRNGDYRLNKEGNYWKNIFSADGRSQSISQEDWEKEKDVVIQTGPRPFLVLLKGQHLIRVRNLSLPKWIGDAVAGLEITSIKDKMRYDHPDLYRQVLSGYVDYVHRLSNKSHDSARLTLESMVVICQPVCIPVDYFFTCEGNNQEPLEGTKTYFPIYQGKIEEDDFKSILEKFKRILGMDQRNGRQ